MKTFPTLYQKTNTGAIQQWEIFVEALRDLGDTCWGVITTVHGQVGGKLQTTSDTIKEGKNPGKANATTAYDQAEKEAQAKWTKQKKKGYVESLADAEAGKVDEAVIKGGIEPMLAPSDIYPKFAKDIKFPCYTQPKFDGNRCIAVVRDGKCTLWTRTRKPINSVPHIVAAIEAAAGAGVFAILDGELYNHEYRDHFEDLMSLIRPPAPVPGHEVVQYHVYDLPALSKPGIEPPEFNFWARHNVLSALLAKFDDSSPIRAVETKVAKCEADIFQHHEANLEAEYEGTMIRNDGPYEQGRRSRHLQKLKTWKDGEFKIVGFFEGRGKDAGTIGAFECETEDKKRFKARLKASYDHRRKLFQDASDVEATGLLRKVLTVKYQNLTSDRIPRFPIGKAIRDYE